MRSGGKPAARGGFTLIEIMIVLLLIGVIATVAVPRIAFYTEPVMTVLQRSVEEAGNLALSGVSVRFVHKPDGPSRRGEIAVEALMKREVEQDALAAFLGTAKPESEVLEWRPIRVSYPPAGRGWRMEPEIIYFFTDGSCTPARLSWVGQGGRDRDAERFLLTVTGYCLKSPAVF